MSRATPGGPQTGEPARAHAIAALRQAILSGDVAPGQRLVEEELAAMLVVTTDEAVAITECRMALEALCAVKAAQHITDDDAARLRELGAELTRAVAERNPLKYSELNRELHRRVGAISGQAVAVGLLARLHAQIVRHQFQLALRPGRPEQSLAEHLAIIDAIAGRRPDDADRAVRRHLNSVIDALRAAGDTTGVAAADTTGVAAAQA